MGTYGTANLHGPESRMMSCASTSSTMIAGVQTEEPGVVVCVTASIGQGIIRPIKAKTSHPKWETTERIGGGAGACVAATSGSSLIRLTRTRLLTIFL